MFIIMMSRESSLILLQFLLQICCVLLLQIATSQAAENEPVSLTDMSDGLHRIQIAPSVQQRCSSEGNEQPKALPASAEAKNGRHHHRLHFDMSKGKCPAEGMLICFPGQMTPNAIAGKNKPSRRHRFVNRGKIAQRCAEKQPAMSAKQEWHGILLHKRELTSTILTLEFSFTSKIYELNNVNKFSIQLDGTSFGASLISDDGSEGKQIAQINGINREEKAAFEQFKAAAADGAFLADYAGLWTLSMQMLPPPSSAIGSNGQKAVLDLYVYRGCKCSMKAWFLKPLVLVPKVPKEDDLPKGSAACPNETKRNQTGENAIQFAPVEEGQTLRIYALLKNSTSLGGNKAKICLFHNWSEADWKKYSETVFEEELGLLRGEKTAEMWQKYNSGHLLNITFVYPENGKKQLLLEGNAIGPKIFQIDHLEKQFTLEIFQHKYHMEFALDGKMVKDTEGKVLNYHFFNWWQPNRINSFQAEGMDILRVDFPHHSPDFALHQSPYTYKLPAELRGNEQIKIKGQICKNTSRMDIQFLHNAEEKFYNGGEEPANGQMVLGQWIMQISSEFTDEGVASFKVLTPNPDKKTWLFGSTPVVHSNALENVMLEPGDMFELRFHVPPRVFDENGTELYEVAFNYDTMGKQIGVRKDHYPLWMINHIHFEGVDLFKEPEIISNPPVENKTSEFSVSILDMKYANAKEEVDLLLPGDRIEIEGQVQANATLFVINFCHGQDNCYFDFQSESKIGAIAFHIQVRFGEGEENKWLLNGCHRTAGSSNCIWGYAKEGKRNPFQPGQLFKLQIHVLDELFIVVVESQNQISTILNGTYGQQGQGVQGQVILGQGVQGGQNKTEEEKAVLVFSTKHQTELLPPWSADHIHVFGDVQINSNGGIKREKNAPNALLGDEQHLLLPGDRVTIEGQVSANATVFAINFCHRPGSCRFDGDQQAWEPNDIGLHIEAWFEGINVWRLHSCVWFEPDDGTQSYCKYAKGVKQEEQSPNPFQPGQPFVLQVDVREVDEQQDMNENKPDVEKCDSSTFAIGEMAIIVTVLNKATGNALAKMCYPVKHLEELDWTFYQIEEKGDINLTKPFKHVRNPMLAGMPVAHRLEQKLTVGTKIGVRCESRIDPAARSITAYSDKIFVGIYHNSLGRHPTHKGLGATLLEVEANVKVELNGENSTEVKLRAFFRSTAADEEPSEQGLQEHEIPWANHRFDVDINVHADRFELFFNQNFTNAYNFTRQLPLWAGEYLFINANQNNFLCTQTVE